MVWNISTSIPLAALIVYAGLLLMTIISKSPTQTRELRTFKDYLIVNMLWSFSAFVLLSFIDSHSTLWFRLMGVFASASTILLTRFVQNITGKNWRWLHWVYFIGLIGAFICVFTPYVFTSAEIIDQHVIYEFGPLIPLAAIPAYVLNIICLVALIRKYRETDDQVVHNRLRYLILAISIIY